MHLDKQRNKNQHMKNLPQCYNYSSNNAISSFKQVKCCNICLLENFKKIEQNHVLSDSLPACQVLTGTDPEPIPQCTTY